MTEIHTIGRCKGCDRMRSVDDGVCSGCLSDPERGRQWAKNAHRCRTDPEYSRNVYGSIESDRGKRLYIVMFGLPEGCAPPVTVPTGTAK